MSIDVSGGHIRQHGGRWKILVYITVFLDEPDLTVDRDGLRGGVNQVVGLNFAEAFLFAKERILCPLPPLTEPLKIRQPRAAVCCVLRIYCL